MPDTPNRRLEWDACYNIRDLGGYVIPNGSTRWGAFLRADTLTRLNTTGRLALREYGIRTVIDMRSSRECASAIHPFAYPAAPGDPFYQVIPLFDEMDSDGIGWVSASRTLAELYEVILIRFSKQIISVLRAIAHARPGGVLFHCHAGKDRTGLIAMFLLAIAGANETTIVADYALSDRYLNELNDEILARYAGEPVEQRRVARLLHTRPEYMHATLERLKVHHGGPLGYLRAAGLSQSDIERIRARIIEPQVHAVMSQH